MQLVSAAIDPQQAAAEPKDRVSGCSRALPEGLWETKVRLNFLSSDCFIDALAAARVPIKGAVSSSARSTERLRGHGIRVVAAEDLVSLAVYVDGADEIDSTGCMIKGGGAALTREKIVAELARQFICIVDETKRVDVLGGFPLPVEVIAMAAPQLQRQFAAIGGSAVLRPGLLTDNGHPILDVHGLHISDPLALEADINQWPGVVTVGLFARRRANVCLLGSASGVQTLSH